MKIVQKLTTILTLAHDEGVIPRNASKNYQFHFEQTDRERLEVDEIFKLYTYQFATKTLEEVKDSYLFGCHTGICFCDASEIRDCDIFIDTAGKEMIKYKRHKTGVEFTVPLTAIPKQIIEKYKGKLPDGRLVPMFANQTINRYLKEIANITGINKHLTYHTARHTFATLCLTLGMPLETIQKMLGHTDIRTTQIYAKIVDVKLQRDMAKLEEVVTAKMEELKITALAS